MVSSGGPRTALLEPSAEQRPAADVPGYGTETRNMDRRHAGRARRPRHQPAPQAKTAASAPPHRRFPAGDLGPHAAGRTDGAVLAVLGTASDDNSASYGRGSAQRGARSPPPPSGRQPVPSASLWRSARPNGSCATTYSTAPSPPNSSSDSAGLPSDRPCPPPTADRSPTPPRSSPKADRARDARAQRPPAVHTVQRVHEPPRCTRATGAARRSARPGEDRGHGTHGGAVPPVLLRSLHHRGATSGPVAA